MNGDIEKILQTQLLANPPAKLDAKVREALDKADGSYRPPLARYSAWVAAAAACLLIGAMLVPVVEKMLTKPVAVAPDVDLPQPLPEIAAAPEPTVIETTWSQITPGSVVLTADNLPLRPLRVQSYRHTRWVDEANKTEIEMTVPEENYYLVSLPVY